jgi:hypothetical protein
VCEQVDTWGDEDLPNNAPLSAAELELLEELARKGLCIEGLVLTLDAQGRTIVEHFATDHRPDALDPHGDQPRQQGLTLDQLGQSGIERFEKREYGWALACFRLERRLRVRCVGAMHPDTLNAANNLAETLRVQGDVACARSMHESVYQIRQRLLGADHPDTLISARNLAEKLFAWGDLAGARRLQEAVYETCQRLHGPDHQHTLTSASQLAVTLSAQGHLADERRIEDEVYQIRLRVLGQQDPATLNSAHNLAETLVSLGDLAAARTLQELVYETSQQVRGPEHPNTLSSANNLAETLRAQGDLVGARRIQESIYEIRRRVLGPEHPNTLTSANNLASTLWSEGDLAGAFKIEQWAYEARQRVLGPEHPATLTSANNVAMTLRDQRDLIGARKILESVYEIRQRVLGPEHPGTLISANNLATTLRAQGDLATAREIQASVYETRQRVLGPEHHRTLAAAHNLVVTLYELEDHAACGILSCTLLQTLHRAGVATDVAFQLAGNMPMLRSPSLPWPAAALGSIRELLPTLSRLLTQRLELLPQESWDRLYRHYELLHRRWLVFASQHAPEQILLALSGLHGIRSFSQVQAEVGEVEAAARLGDGERSATAAEYLQARQGLNALRERIADLVARMPDAPDLPGLLVDERQLTQSRERAETQLTQSAPDLAATVGALRPLRSDEVALSLKPNEAWLAFLPGEPAFAYLLRPDDEPSWLKLGDLGGLGQACTAWADGVRSARRGLLRDNEAVRGALEEPPEARTPNPHPTLAELRLQAQQAFWQPLEPALQGVQRLHLVTGAGYHDLLLEFALPPALAQLQVLRYCGLPAYQRSLLPDMQGTLAPLQPGGLSFVADDGWFTHAPIPFTRLDPLVPEHAGLLRRLTDDQVGMLAGEASDGVLHRTDSAVRSSGLRLMLSTHGRTAGQAGGLGGQVLLPGGKGNEHRWLKPQLLAAQGQRVELLFSLSCWGARVGDSGQGDAYGTMSTLQLAGLRGAIGCLAPVADFYTPLLSAFIWDGLLQGRDLVTSLQRATQRLRHGSWADMQPVLQPLRQGYRELMLELLQHTSPVPGEGADNAQARNVLQGVIGWSLPGRWRRLLGSDVDSDLLAKVLPTTQQAQERFVDACLDILLRDPADRDHGDRDEDGPVAEAIDSLCAVTVVFGRY